jgi:hypothetical protein
MFSRLTDFSTNRSAIGALGFYISYFALTLIIGMIIGVGLSIFMPEYSMREGRVLATAFAMLICLALSLLILQGKKLNTSVPLIILALASTVFAGLGGAAFGLLIPTYLSVYNGTKKSTPKKKTKRK